MSSFIGWSEKKIEEFINDVYGGVFDVDNLPPKLYEAILNKMTDAIIEGFDGIKDNIDISDISNKFEQNVKFFSFAKTFHQINDMENILFDSKGIKNSFSDFKKTAKEIFDIYNNTWLETEFNTAISMTQGAGNFLQFIEEKEALPLLRYSTVEDERVRKSHASLNGIIRPVEDGFWDTHAVPNDFNCRCIIEQLEEGDITDLSKKKIEEIPKMFNNNPAKTGVLFGDKHPYFKGLGKRKNAF